MTPTPSQVDPSAMTVSKDIQSSDGSACRNFSGASQHQKRDLEPGPSEATPQGQVKHDISCGSCGKMFRDFALEGAPTCDCGERAVRAMKEEITRVAPVNAGVREALEKVWSQIEGAKFENIEDDDDLVVITIEAKQARSIRAALASQPVVSDPIVLAEIERIITAAIPKSSTPKEIDEWARSTGYPGPRR